MKNHYYLLIAAFLGAIVASCTSKPVTEAPDASSASRENNADSAAAAKQHQRTVRFATFNVSMNRKTEGELRRQLEKGEAVQIRRVAEVIQRVRPQVILLNEFDYDPEGKSVELFCKNFLGVSQSDQEPIEFAYHYVGPVNTGIKSGLDIDQDGKVALPGDGYGFGAFPGQYGMVVLSQFPVDHTSVRTFQDFLWKDMPDAKQPVNPQDSSPFYPEDVFSQMRLSSKSHWDIPVQINGRTVHLICSHPTPPVFDGPEDRNGCRNHDEIRMVADYVSGRADYLYDDKGVKGGLEAGSSFVIVGDLNADPTDGDSTDNAVLQLTTSEHINHSVVPASKGAVAASKTSGGKNREHRGDPAFDTGDFNDEFVGNMRIDYCLPSKDLKIGDCGVFWPLKGEDGYSLNRASDHHLVWVDIELD